MRNFAVDGNFVVLVGVGSLAVMGSSLVAVGSVAVMVGNLVCWGIVLKHDTLLLVES